MRTFSALRFFLVEISGNDGGLLGADELCRGASDAVQTPLGAFLRLTRNSRTLQRALESRSDLERVFARRARFVVAGVCRWVCIGNERHRGNWWSRMLE